MARSRRAIVVLSCGRALALDPVVQKADAILVGWFLGSESGRALADVLTGRESPSGRLPVSFPLLSGQQPYFYNHKSTGRPQLPGEGNFFKARYSEVPNSALFPFGHGLGYAPVDYGATQVDAATLPWDGSLTVSALVRNTGSRAVDELVQLYVHDVAASITRPVRELKDFRRVRLAAGVGERVRFTLTRQDLAFVGQDLSWRTEPGRFLVWICPSAEAGQPAAFDLAAPTAGRPTG